MKGHRSSQFIVSFCPSSDFYVVLLFLDSAKNVKFFGEKLTKSNIHFELFSEKNASAHPYHRINFYL